MEPLKNPLSVQLEITDRCNYHCAHCYHLDFDHAHASGELSEQRFLSLAEKIVEARVFSTIITGGEPLIRSDLAIKLVSFLKKAGQDVSLNTNLSLADSGVISNLIRSGLDTFLISCPAAGVEKYREMTGGDYAKFLNNIGYLVSQECDFAINMVVNTRNIGLIRETAAAMRDLGVERFGATPMALNPLRPDLGHFLTLDQVRFLVEELLWVRSNLGLKVDIFEALPKCVFPPEVLSGDYRFLRRSCQAGKTIVSIGCNGDVRPCSHSDKVFGNLLREDLPSIWKKMSGYRDESRIPGACSDCKVLNRCFGGCRVTAETYAGGKNPVDPWMTEALDENPFWPAWEKELLPGKVLSLPGDLRFRQDGEDAFAVTTAKFVSNLALVNGELLAFLQYIARVKRSTIGMLAQGCKTSFSSHAFQSTIRKLLNYRLIKIN